MRLYSAVLLLSVASALTAQVTFDRILNSSKEPRTGSRILAITPDTASARWIKSMWTT